MSHIYINFTDNEGKVVKTFTIVEIKTGKMDKLYELADSAREIKGMKNIAEWHREVKALFVDIFHKQFTYDELEEGVTTKELMRCFNSMVWKTDEAIEKNSEGEQG